MTNWQDKIVIVTGGASGIGAAIVHKFSTRGVTPIIFDINGFPEKRSGKK